MKITTSWSKGLLLLTLSGLSLVAFTQDVPDPESYFGFKPGADYKLIRWDKIVNYFNVLDEKSPRIIVKNLGKTTLGNPFLLAVISSPENLSLLDKYKDISKKLAQGKISKEVAAELAKEGKTIALITCSMHADEAGPTQMSPELAYSLATSSSPAIKNVLENVILLLVPSWNPDGNIMITDWYNQNVGTPFETSPLPRLWHHYTGHDINRDGFMHTQVEIKYVNNILYHEWFPQIFMDMHQYLWREQDARLLLSPLYEPRHPSIHPLVTRQIELTGAHMRTLLEENGKTGVMHYAKWNEWRIATVHTNSLWHNVTNILFEAGNTQLATPVFQKESELSELRGGLGHDGNKLSVNYPNPWKGGWWRLRDIVEYAYLSCIGFLESGAIHRERFLMNIYQMARNSIEKGETSAPYAFTITQNQKDPNRVAMMVNILISNGVEIHQAIQPFKADNIDYPSGTYVVKLSQAYRPFIIDILSPQYYPDRYVYPGGPPEGAGDIAWTLPYQMGVDLTEIKTSFTAHLLPVSQATPPNGNILGTGKKYIIDHNVLDSYRALNRLLKEGNTVGWSKQSFVSGGKQYPAGTLVATGGKIDPLIAKLADEHHLQIVAGNPKVELHNLKPLRLGLYQPWIANKSEGWTRWIFDTWGFPYSTLHNADMQNLNLKSDYDVIILPDINSENIISGHPKGSIPEEYVGGIGEVGLLALEKFVNEGGTLVTLNSSFQLPIDLFRLPLKDISKSHLLSSNLTSVTSTSTEFFCPNAILNVELTNNHPITFGMDSVADILYTSSPVLDFFDADELAKHKDYLPVSNLKVVAQYPDRNPFRSGRLMGDLILRKKPALIEATYGKGKIVIFPFHPQYRAQTHGTFMLFFNSLYYNQAAFDH